jgi:hypothetical protein
MPRKSSKKGKPLRTVKKVTTKKPVPKSTARVSANPATKVGKHVLESEVRLNLALEAAQMGEQR